LYFALATAVGYVDFRVRTHHERDLAYTAAVVAGTEEPPGRYRILAPYVFEGLTRLTRLSPGDAWFLFRWLGIFCALLAGHLYFRTWFPTGVAVAGNLLMVALLPLTFTNAWAHPDHFVELCLFTLACACIAREWIWAFALALVLNALNRETSAFLVMLFFLARRSHRWHVAAPAGFTVLWQTVSLALRWRLGFAPYDPWQFKQNVQFLGLLPPAFDPYYRAFAWFVVVMIVPLLVLIARSWSIQTRFSKVATGIVAPAFLTTAFLFSSIVETRIFTPLLPLLLPGAIAALFTPRSSPI
jgi:hypothetical protein